MASAITAMTAAEAKIKDSLKDLHRLIKEIQEERSRGEHNLSSISKAQERMQQEQKGSMPKLSPYHRSKLRSLYGIASQDAATEAELLRRALDKIAEIKLAREKGTLANGERPKQIMRRGVLMSMLQQNAVSLKLWVSKPGESPPPLCGCVPSEPDYIAKPGDKVAAHVHSTDDEDNWIMADVISYSETNTKYDVEDIDAEEGKEHHTLSREEVVPLPLWKANPDTDPDALFQKDALVLALYPQTTCFYIAVIHTPPKKPNDDYWVLFEDVSYPGGYSPPLKVAQRYVIAPRDEPSRA